MSRLWLMKETYFRNGNDDISGIVSDFSVDGWSDSGVICFVGWTGSIDGDFFDTVTGRKTKKINNSMIHWIFLPGGSRNVST